MLTSRRAWLVAAAVAAALSAPAPAAAGTAWLCHPDLSADPCRPSLRTTVFTGWDRQQGVKRPRRARRPAVDCFYAYPTVSDQPAALANLDPDPPIRSVALFQVARYSQHCRVFAPLYRQLTLAAIGGSATPADAAVAYGDVLAAWREYLARENRGRGMVLIGHSQGAAHLTRLVRTQIDRRPAVRRRLVSALLLGADVMVRRGRDAGGSFAKVRACRSRRQTGCVVAFSAFGETPPPGALFGRGSVVRQLGGGPGGSRHEALCTNPAALGGGRGRLDAILPSAPFAPGSSLAAGIGLLGLALPQVTTPFIELRGAYAGRCSRAGGAHVLRISPRGGAPRANPSPDVTWGLHLIDANVALGNLVDLVGRQIAAYRARD